MIEKNKIIDLNNVERVEASVKWYNPEKGYGFLNRGDNSGDIMIHFSVLDKVKCPYIKPGDHIICDVVSGKSGAQVVRIIEIKFGSREPRSFSGFLSPQLISVDPKDLEEIEGVIKWYNPSKGYGFVCPDDGRKEIFLHGSVVRAAGYKALEPGVRVLAKVFISERGEEARLIRVLSKESQDII